MYKNALSRTHRAWIEIDTDALRHNVHALQALLPAHCALLPAVKADAYGHGAVLVSLALSRMGIRHFCVASIDEAIELRKGGITGDILILGYTHPDMFPLLSRYDLIQTVVDEAYAALLQQSARKIRVHIAVDTGMHRLGIRSGQTERLYHICQMENLQAEGIFTHLCAADTDRAADRAFTLGQAEAFYRTVSALKDRGLPCLKTHLQASYGILNYPELSGDYARPGIILYGVKSARNDFDRSAPSLIPVLSLKARIAAVKPLSPGESSGYGRTFTADRPVKTAILAIGYADGIPRTLSCGNGEVLIHGQRAPVIGRICMDQMTVDITKIPDVHTGDTAVLIGKSGDEVISAYDIAEKSGTITNEILSRLGARLKRIVTVQPSAVFP